MECLGAGEFVRDRDFGFYLTNQRVPNITEIVNSEHFLATIQIDDLGAGWSSGATTDIFLRLFSFYYREITITNRIQKIDFLPR